MANAKQDKLIEALEALFAVVATEARANPAFARRLEKAMGGSPAATGVVRPKEAASIDLGGLFADAGPDGVRSALTPLTRSAIYALVRSGGLAPSGASRLTKAQLIEHAVGALKRRAGPRKRVLDY